MSETSGSYYDHLAPYYRDVSSKRRDYLSAVERFIVRNAPVSPQSLLDIGSGDGVRARNIAQALNVRTVFLTDASAEMVKRCELLQPTRAIHTVAEKLPDLGRKFDVVLCLWNVLGHIEDRSARVEALRRMSGHMLPGSLLFVDVNNRHNADSYGWLTVSGRKILDRLWPDERRGDVSFDWVVDGKKVPGKGHLFTPREVLGLFADAGLQVKNAVSVNYNTGEVSPQLDRGQLLFRLALT